MNEEKKYLIKNYIKSDLSKILISFLIYLIYTIIVTYPLIRDLKNQIPADLGDPILNVWTLWWDSESIINLNIKNYFNANVMFPYQNALAFSEHLTGEAILGIPIYLIIKDPIFVYNFLYLLSFLIAGIGMFTLTHYITRDILISFISGFIFAFVPHRFGQAGHIQTLFSGFFPICIYYLFRLIDNIKSKDFLLLTIFIVLQSLMNMYYIVYLALILPLIGIPYIIYKKRLMDIKLYLYLILTAIISFIILLPFLTPYIELREAFGLTRDIKTIASLPDIKNLIGINRFNILYRSYLAHLDINEGSFFLGITVSLFAIAGIFFANITKIYKTIFLLIIIFSFLIISGPNPVIKINNASLNYGFIYRFLYHYFPAFDGTRVPMRFYIFIAMSISLFAGSGINLINNIKNNYIRLITLGILLILISIEYYSKIPIISYNKFTDPPEILKTIKNLRNGAVIYFPLKHTYEHIMYASITEKPTYTSVTGYIHSLNKLFLEIENNPSQEDLSKFAATGIKYIVLTDKNLKQGFDKLKETDRVKIEKIYEKSDGVIYKLEYKFNGYFSINDFKEIDYSVNTNTISIYLISDIEPDDPKVPLRLFFNSEVILKNDSKVIKRSHIKLKIPEIIKEKKILLTKMDISNDKFNEIEIILYERKKDSKIFLKKIFDQSSDYIRQ